MAWEGKKYKLDRQDNFEEYMKALGKCREFAKSLTREESSVRFLVKNYHKEWVYRTEWRRP